MIKIKIKKRMETLGAVVLILGEDDDLLLLKRPKWITWAAGKWALPGGKLENGETPLDAAIRETKEETRLDVRNLQLVNVCLDKPVTTYYTREFSGDIEIDFEHDAWSWASRSEIETYDLAPDVLETYDWVLAHGN
jgi:8-oxo-dGTP pyrophosphatase MutT (NUDIX family)